MNGCVIGAPAPWAKRKTWGESAGPSLTAGPATVFAGGTIYAWSEILETFAMERRGDVGALRVRTIATKDLPCTDFPRVKADGTYVDGVVLELDYWVMMPR